jgi:alpha-glucoside transport system permease protein
MAPAAPLVAWLYLAPALLFLSVFLVYPVVNTVYLSFLNRDSSVFVGLQNYVTLFTNPETLTVFRNNLLWLTIFTGMVVALGLIIAVLTNQVRYEATAKAIIFIPMAISFTAAAVIWRFM